MNFCRRPSSFRMRAGRPPRSALSASMSRSSSIPGRVSRCFTVADFPVPLSPYSRTLYLRKNYQSELLSTPAFFFFSREKKKKQKEKRLLSPAGCTGLGVLAHLPS